MRCAMRRFWSVVLPFSNVTCISGIGPSLRSGFRLRAPVRLRLTHARKPAQLLLSGAALQQRDLDQRHGLLQLVAGEEIRELEAGGLFRIRTVHGVVLDAGRPLLA